MRYLKRYWRFGIVPFGFIPWFMSGRLLFAVFMGLACAGIFWLFWDIISSTLAMDKRRK